MNALVLFASIGIDPQLCGRLCLVLAHSVWQVGLLALVATLVTRFQKRENPELGYAVYVAALLVGLAALPITYSLVEIDPQVVEASRPVAADLPSVMPIVQPRVEQTAQLTPPIALKRGESQSHAVPTAISNEKLTETFLLRFAPWLAGCYAVGVLVMLLRLGQGIWKSYKLARDATPVGDGALNQAFQKIVRAWSLRVVPVLAQAQEIIVPQVVGLLRPTILLPTSAISGLTPEELEMILAHELAHVRRHDMWVNLLQRLAESVLFFNPALWYLSRQVSTYREYCCDEQTCRVKQDEAAIMRLRYAQALLHVVELSGKGTQRAEIAALAATGAGPSELRRRVARLFGEPLREPIGLSRNAMLSVVAGLVLVIAGPAAWQNAAESKTETAEVLEEKPSSNKVEVVAIGTHDEEQQKWWDSEGKPIDDLPFEWEDDHRELPAGSKWRRVVIRVNGLPADHEHADLTWRILGSPNFWGVPVKAKSKSDKAKYFARYFDWDGESDTFGLRVGRTRGEWKTVARRMTMTSKPQANSIVFSDPRMTDQGLNVIVSHDVADQAYRIVAIDREQKQHRSASGGGNSVGRLVQSEGTFPGLKQEDLDHFEFQTRKYEWTKINGLPAEPAKVANVKPITQRETAEVLEEKRSGAKVEIFAIGTHDEEPQRWWNADGDLIKAVPFTWKKEPGKVTTEKDSLWRRVVIRIDGNIANSPRDRVWQIVGARGFSGGTIVFTGPFEPGTYLTRYYSLPKGVESFELQVGLTTGDWKTLVKSNGMGAHGWSGKSVVFSEPMSTNQGIDVIVSHNIKDQAYQVVAVDKSGLRHESLRSGGTSSSTISQTRGTFPGLTAEELDHFEFQVRDYEWTEIKDLPVEPSNEVAETANETREMRVKVVDSEGNPISGVKFFRNLTFTNPTDGKTKIENEDYFSNEGGDAVVALAGDPRSLKIWATKPGYVPMHASWTGEQQENGDKIPQEFEFRMNRGTKISGIVTNVAGIPIPGVKVEVTENTHNTSADDSELPRPFKRPVRTHWIAYGSAGVMTDAEGRWTVENIPSDKELNSTKVDSPDKAPLLLRFSHPEYETIDGIEDYQTVWNPPLEQLRDGTSRTVMHWVDKNDISRENSIRLDQGKTYENADFQLRNFAGQNLMVWSDRMLKGANATFSGWRDMFIPGMDESFQETDFSRARLKKIRMSGRSGAFQRAVFDGAELESAEFHGGVSAFQEASFDSASVTNSSLEGDASAFQVALFRNAKFQSSMLKGMGSAFQQAVFDGAKIVRTTIVCDSPTAFEGVSLNDTEFVEADLSSIDAQALASCEFDKATPPRYDGKTKFPEGFDPEEEGWKLIQ